MTYIEEYYRKMMSGEITACTRIKQVYAKLIDDMNDHSSQYIFDADRANAPIEFIERFCKQAQGEIGQPLKLMLFQKAKIQAVFGFIDKDTGYRKYKEVLDIRGRKNGKTTELAAMNIYMNMADGEGAAENYCVATKSDQAYKCFNEIINMVKQSSDLSRHIRKRKSDLFFDLSMSYIKPLSSNVNSLDGLNSHMVTIDELSAIKKRDLYDLMKQSMSARRQPLLYCITTNGFVRNSIFDSQYEYACKILDGKIHDETFLPFIYELDDRDEWDNESMWEKSNPGLGCIKNKDDLRSFVNKAKNDPSFKATVMVKDFNMVENSSSAWLRWEELNNETKFDVKEMGFRYGIGGFDLAETTDLAAAKVMVKNRDSDDIYVLQMYWTPADTLEKKTAEDKIPYNLWEKQGLLRVCQGNKIDPYDVLKWFIEVQNDLDIYISWIGYDPWHVDASLLKAYENNFGKDTMRVVRQGVITLSAPMKELKADMIAGRIIYNNNPIDKWCLANTEIKTDINGNIQPIKGGDATQRIDGTVALIIAYVTMKENMIEYEAII